MNVKVKYLSDVYKDNPLEFIGGKGHSCWIDLRAANDIELNPGEYTLIPLGIAVQLPDGYEAIIAPRSSSFKKFGVIQTNSIGVIDTSYCGNDDEWKWAVFAINTCHIKKGDRVCQFRIQRVMDSIEIEEVDDLENESRGGFGSSGV